MRIDLKTHHHKKRDKEIKKFFIRKKKKDDLVIKPEKLSEEKFAESINSIHWWKGAEFEAREKNHKWQFAAAILLAAIVGYAVYTNSPIMAITFILIGVVGYIQLQKEPRTISFHITAEGVAAGREIYEFEEMNSFWIFYDPPQMKVLSLHMKEKIIPYVHIPLHSEDPVKIRSIMMDFVPETKHEMTLADALERILGI